MKLNGNTFKKLYKKNNIKILLKFRTITFLQSYSYYSEKQLKGIPCYTDTTGVFLVIENTCISRGNKNIPFNIYYEDFIKEDELDETFITISAYHSRFVKTGKLDLSEKPLKEVKGDQFDGQISLVEDQNSEIRFLDLVSLEVRYFEEETKLTVQLDHLNISDLTDKPFIICIYANNNENLWENEKCIEYSIYYNKKVNLLQFSVKLYKD
jgi:hypothetical protein